jgi:putative hemolysin
MSTIVEVLIIVVCCLLAAFFSASETALLRLHDAEVEHDARVARVPGAVAVRELLRSTSRLLVTILLGSNVVNVLGVSVASALAVGALGEEWGILTSTVVMTVVALVFCEVLPKAVAASHARPVAHAVALPLYLAHQMLRPVHFLFDKLIDPMVRRLTGPTEPDHLQSAEQLLRMARQMPAGQSDGTPLAIIGAAAGAADTTVSDIMVPRTEMVALQVDTSPAELLETMLEERYTRAPIYADSIDEILGIVHLKSLISVVRGGGKSIRGILQPVLRVPARKPILRLLTDMQRAFVHVAIVKDEFGVTLGMVTQEDILEELVGEIRDEFDREELTAIRRQSDGSYRSLGRVKVLDFNRETGWDLTAERGDTLSGLVFNELGRSPSRGDVVEIPGHRLEVVDVSGTRITEVRVAQVDVGERAGNGMAEHG